MRYRLPYEDAIVNMRALRCPHCGGLIEVFRPVADERSILRDVPLLGSLPLDPAYAQLDGIPEPFLALADRVAACLK